MPSRRPDSNSAPLVGVEATRRTVERWTNGNRSRIVAMTADVMQDDRDECLSGGMDDFVTNPSRVDELVEALLQAAPRDV